LSKLTKASVSSQKLHGKEENLRRAIPLETELFTLFRCVFVLFSAVMALGVSSLTVKTERMTQQGKGEN